MKKTSRGYDTEKLKEVVLAQRHKNKIKCLKKKSKTDYRYIQYIYIKHDKNVCVLCYNIHLQVCELQ